MYKIIDGKKLAAKIIDDVGRHIIAEKLEPQLGVILVGNDPASRIYVQLKEKACEQIGIIFNKYLFDEDAPEEEIIKTIQFLNADRDIDAILIQLPLPEKYNQQKIMDTLEYRKDVDGFHRINIERYLAGKKQHLLPGLPLAIWNLIASTGGENYHGPSLTKLASGGRRADTIPRHAVIVGKSEAFTRPTQKMLADRGIPTDIISPADPHVKEKTLTADILITAIGAPAAITADMVKEGATVIDVGISKKDGRTVGDVDFERVAQKCAYITPVPGGVGPMTVAMLLYNTLILARERRSA